MKITFRGAAQTVTGSMHEVETNGARLLLDCGLFQGKRREANERNKTFPWPGSSVEAVLLSHAHIDHSGNLPNLVKNGFSGPIYTTSATADLCNAMLQDSAFIQEKDATFMNRRAARRRGIGVEDGQAEIQPLYTIQDALAAIALFRRVDLHTPTEVSRGVTYTTFEAGHMLGSTAMKIEAEGKCLIFSGDVGRKGLPIIHDPETMPTGDYLIMESTYGDRLHKDEGAVQDKLADIINRTIARGGRIIVPSFAVGRAQQLVVLIHELSKNGRIPSIPIFVDSPLAVNVTEVFRKHEELFDEDMRAEFRKPIDPFGFSKLQYIRSVEESKALNDLRGSYLVIAASGMCEAGRILHHLRNGIGDPRNTVLITGFQAENTLGRKILDGEPEVNIFGEPSPVRAEIARINELSGHADQGELLAWMEPIVTPRLKSVFLVHGEPLQQEVLKKAIEARYKLQVIIPKRGDSVTL